MDLATANQLGAETSVLLGLGDGTFVAARRVGAAIRSTPVVADLDGDGAADIAVANRAGEHPVPARPARGAWRLRPAGPPQPGPRLRRP